MSAKKPISLFAQCPRPLCPVCGKTSYSAAGIHPQCAVRRLDAERMKAVRLQATQGQRRKFVSLTDMSPRERACPSCNAALHVRKKCCACGYVFASSPASLTLEGEVS